MSSSPVPPRSNYKMDYVFYVSATQLMGTMQLNVFDSGSGSVVKSMVSKSAKMEGWKEKGLSFYVLKGGPQGSTFL